MSIHSPTKKQRSVGSQDTPETNEAGDRAEDNPQIETGAEVTPPPVIEEAIDPMILIIAGLLGGVLLMLLVQLGWRRVR